MSFLNAPSSRLVLSLLCSSFVLMSATHEGALSGYTQEAVDLVEFLYGDGILSLGGIEAIDDMFMNVQLAHKDILDIGSGSGGVDTYLAQKYPVTILGIDPEKMLVERATQRASQLQKSFKGSVKFEQLISQASLSQYPDNTFDIVMSREAILHVPHAEKKKYFAEMFRVLKPGGLLIIDDWLHTSSDYTAAVKEMIEADGIPYNLISPAEYEDTLVAVGFTNIALRDTTNRAYKASSEVYKKAQECNDEMISRFGKDMSLFALKSWSLQTEIFKNRELLTYIVSAQKPSEVHESTQYSYMLKATPGRGVGVFAIHDIPAGTSICDLTKFKIRICHKSEVPQELIGHCIHQENDQEIAPDRFDHMPIYWYMNHSEDSANVKLSAGISVEDGQWLVMPMHAVKDIKAGEELLANYNELGEPDDSKEDFYRPTVQ
jgi:phosphoethanolamine N-methyltransferase